MLSGSENFQLLDIQFFFQSTFTQQEKNENVCVVYVCTYVCTFFQKYTVPVQPMEKHAYTKRKFVPLETGNEHDYWALANGSPLAWKWALAVVKGSFNRSFPGHP